jgi:hypothetical protein
MTKANIPRKRTSASPDFVSPQEDFTVRLGAEHFAALRQLLAEFQIVVQFAVENEMKSAR